MATKISTGDISAASGEAVRRKRSNSEDTKGASADQIRWDTLRGRACRLFLSDPDARVQLYYLASNTLSSELRTFHALVCEAISLAESSFSSKETSASIAADLSTKKAALYFEVGNMRASSPSAPVLPTTLKEAAASYANAVAKQSSRNRKIERGDSAGASLPALLAEATKRGRACVSLISVMEQTGGRLETLLGRWAVAPILPGLAASLRDPSLAPKEELLKVVAAVGAYDAFTAPATTLLLVHTGVGFPSKLVPRMDGAVLTLLDANGKETAPATLLVSQGCVVTAGTATATILSISGRELTLSSEISVSGGISIATKAQSELSAFVGTTLGAISANSLTMPASLLRGVSFRKLNRPEAYKIVKGLVQVATELADITTEASRSAALLGVDVPVTKGLLSAVREFSPSVAESSRRGASEILDALRADGLDVVETALLSSDLWSLDTPSVHDARRSSKTAYQVGQLMEIINPDLKV